MEDITTSMPRITARARHGGPPPALARELARPHLVRRLADRWEVPVTVVVAGAGFGKSTLLAQACRADAAAPPGIQAWVSCDRDDDRDATLAAAIHAAIGGGAAGRDPLVATTEALRRLAPVDVCLVLDDVHRLRDGSSGGRLLAGLVAALPAHVHLVLVGRSLPQLPLARLRAADGVLELREADLAFGTAEIERLAAGFGRPAATAGGFGGWPALVRVALAAPAGTAIRYAREEVIADLDPADRRALLALATVGTADDEFVSRVVGAPVALARLAASVPMVRASEDGRFEAHDLWLDALARAIDAGEAALIRDRAVDELLATGQVARAGDVAIAAGDGPALSRAALALVRSTVSVLPRELARRWLDAARDLPTSPELRLLDAAHRAASDFADRSVDAALDEVAAELRARGDPAGEVAALAVGTVAAQSRGDTDRLVALAVRTADVASAGDHPVVRLARCSIGAVVAEMQGDPEQAVAEFAALPADGLPVALAVSADRFLMHCLLLAGRADEAVAIADRVPAATASPHCRTMPAFARWLAGDPSGFARYSPPDVTGASDRDAFVARAFHAVIAASHGEVVDVEDGRDVLANPRDAAVLANARAAHAVLRGDEAAAAAAIAAVAAAHPGSRLADRHLRRFLALGYVLDPARRAAWDAAALGPSHERARNVARLLVDLRTRPGARPRALEPDHVRTALPLPWSVELACRLHERGADDGRRLAESLLDAVGCRAHRALRSLVATGDERVAAGAASLVALLPREPETVVAVDVLGPLQVRHGADVATGGDVRRQRVRELLAMLVVDGTVARDRAIDALWPDLDVATGGRNLRVTLTYLRRLLEPDRAAGEASFHVRADASTIRLVPSPMLRVDLWEQRRLAAEADAARAVGDVARAIDALAAATALWRGSPLTDLDRVPGYEAEIERLRLLRTTALLELGGLRLTVGDAAGALGDAERAVATEPYLEAAHRLAIAAAIQRGDRARVLAAVTRVGRVLAELGTAPEPATAMLLRSATRDHAALVLAS